MPGATSGARSSGLERDVQEFCGRFSLLQALGDYTEGKGLHAGDGFVAIGAITHDACESWHLSCPAAVLFALDFHEEIHTRNRRPSRMVNKGDRITPAGTRGATLVPIGSSGSPATGLLDKPACERLPSAGNKRVREGGR